MLRNRKLAWLAVLLAFLSLMGITYAIVGNAPYLPGEQEAANYVLKRYSHSSASTGFDVRDGRISQIQPLGKMQLVVSRYTQVENDNEAATMAFFFIDFVTKYPVRGLESLNTIGSSLPETSGPAFALVSGDQDEYYIIGGASNVADIHYAELHWLEGTVTKVPLVDGTFLAFNSDGAQLAWVVGLDEQEKLLSDTLTYNHQINFSLSDYSAIREIFTDEGLIVMVAFSSDTPQQHECVELTYLTGENVAKYLADNGALNGQRLCFEPGADEVVTPAVITTVGDQTVAGGRVLDVTIEQVNIEWSDGLQQTESVVNGFYFAQRPNTSSTILKISVSD